MKIKTESGFICDVNPRKVKDWRFIKLLAKADEESELGSMSATTQLLSFLLGKEDEENLYKFVEKDGVAEFEDVVKVFKEILKICGENQETKK
jgi:hypothetical protein